MESTMQAPPLLISQLLRFGTTLHAQQEVVTWAPDGARRITFRELGEQAAQLAHALRSLGVTGDDRVATFMWNNAEHAVAYLGVPSMGAVLHALNIRLYPPQIIYTANHAGSKVVIVDNTLAGPFSQILPHLEHLRHVIVNGPVDEATRDALAAPAQIEAVHDYAALLADQPTSYDWPEDLDELSASSMCYTSGTTGHPKAVAYSHRANYLHAMGVALTLGIQQGDRLLVVVPLFHANAWGFPYVAMATGASMMMPDRYLQAEPLARFIETEGITKGAGVPTIWSDLLRYLDENEADVSSCTMLMVGGAAAPPAMMRAFQEKHGITIIHGWGMTETTPVGTLAVPPREAEVGSDEYWRYRQAQGRLLCGVEARIVGPTGEELPWDGESVGRFEVKGPWITGRYHLNGEETDQDRAEMEAKFDGEWFDTGDMGVLTKDGFLILTDRAKDAIKSGGEWISSVDLENAIMAHPDVVEASVVGVPDDRWGERPLATVVVREGSEVDPVVLREFLEGRMAHWQIPERWAFIDEVPKTSVGKFDKKVIRARYAEGTLDVLNVH